MASPERFQGDVARLALQACGRHGFALAGGQALIAHGIVNRATEDIDLFTDETHGVQAAAEPVVAVLRAAGLTVEEVRETAALGEMIDGLDLDMIEYQVRDGEDTVRLQLVRFDRSHRPVAMAIGPVLHLDDTVATKVVALATRAEPRDLIDVAAILARYTRTQLIDLAHGADPSLTEEEFAAAMRRLDRLDDAVFSDLYRLTTDQITNLRDRFADWPRP